MGCFAALLALMLPRFTLFLLWVFTDRLDQAFDSFIVGFLGFLVLPYTTVLYALAYAPVQGVTGFGWFLVVFGFLLDIGALTGGSRQRRQSMRSGQV